MLARQSLGYLALLMLVLVLSVCALDAAQAIERWPPWQSYGDAENSARAKLKRHAVPKQSEIDALNRKVGELRSAGKSAEAIAAAKGALVLTERAYGPNHAATAAALTRLAELLIEQKRYADAEPLLKRALAIREKDKGSSPRETAVALDNLAALYEKQGNSVQAKPLADRAAGLRGGKSREAEGKRKAETESARAEAEAKRRAEAEAKYQAEARSAAEAKRNAEAARDRAQAAPPAPNMLDKKSGGGGLAAPKATPDSGSATTEESAGSARSGGGAGPQAEAVRPRARAYHREVPPPGTAMRGAPEAPPAPPVTAEKKDGGGGASGGGAGGGASGNAPRAERMESMPPAARSMARRPVPEPPMPSLASPPPAPPAAAAAAKEAEKWDVVPVFYGTDRAKEPNPKRVAYNSDRGHRLELGRALVTVPKVHQVPQVERPWAIRIPYFDVTIYEQAEDPNKHFTMQEIKNLSHDDFLRLVRERLGGSDRYKDQALVFVHGYNTSFDNAVYRTAQIAYDLKFDGVPFLYSWPSGGGVASYTYDRESAEASKPYMRKFLEMVVKETGAKSVSIIAHSMGNQPLLDVLKDMKAAAPKGVEISQIILAAPDVDADSFAALTQAITGLAKGVTLYAAANDRALQVSRNFWGHYRAGDVPAGGPLVVPGVDSIDVTALSTDTFAINHSDYAQKNELLKDIGELLLTGMRPPGQRAMKPVRVTTDKGAYWRYATHPSP